MNTMTTYPVAVIGRPSKPTRTLSLHDRLERLALDTDFDPKVPIDRRIYRRWLKEFASTRPRHGLAEIPTPLTALTIPHKDVHNAKLGKSALPTVSLTLAAHRDAAYGIYRLNTCEWAGSCASMCVLGHGKGLLSTVRAARAWRTECLWRDPVAFLALLRYEIHQHAEKHGRILVRLNVASDLPWEKFPSLFNHPNIQAYDYTKDPHILDHADGFVLPNYRKVYSLNEYTDDKAACDFLLRGGTISVVTNRKVGDPTMGVCWIDRTPFDLLDGDSSDDRFSAPRGVVIDLAAKGRARGERGIRTGFVQEWY